MTLTFSYFPVSGHLLFDFFPLSLHPPPSPPLALLYSYFSSSPSSSPSSPPSQSLPPLDWTFSFPFFLCSLFFPNTLFWPSLSLVPHVFSFLLTSSLYILRFFPFFSLYSDLQFALCICDLRFRFLCLTLTKLAFLFLISSLSLSLSAFFFFFFLPVDLFALLLHRPRRYMYLQMKRMPIFSLRS